MSESRFKRFGESIKQALIPSRMFLPDRTAAPLFRCHNYDYSRIRCNWQDANDVLDLEHSLMVRLEQADNFQSEYRMVEDEIFSDENQMLRGLDLGVAGLVLALAARRCVTTYSCNGGCFYDFHHAKFPTVTFYADPGHAAALLRAARATAVGIDHEADGALIVWANDIRNFNAFAKQLRGRRKI